MLVAGGFCGNLFAFHLPDECHLQKRSDVRRVVFRRKVMPDIADGIADRQNGWLRGCTLVTVITQYATLFIISRLLVLQSVSHSVLSSLSGSAYY